MSAVVIDTNVLLVADGKAPQMPIRRSRPSSNRQTASGSAGSQN